jgi:hypothetical protein
MCLGIGKYRHIIGQYRVKMCYGHRSRIGRYLYCDRLWFKIIASVKCLLIAQRYVLIYKLVVVVSFQKMRLSTSKKLKKNIYRLAVD